jgi:hypothetical protein
MCDCPPFSFLAMMRRGARGQFLARDLFIYAIFLAVGTRT